MRVSSLIRSRPCINHRGNMASEKRSGKESRRIISYRRKSGVNKISRETTTRIIVAKSSLLEITSEKIPERDALFRWLIATSRGPLKW